MMPRRALTRWVWGAALLAGLAGCAKPRPSADQVLARLSQAYRNLKTLRERVEVNIQTAIQGEVVAPPQDMKLSWTFAQPDKIHYEVSGYRAVTVAADGKKAYTVLPEALECVVSNPPAKLSDLPSLQYATAAMVGINELRLLEGSDPRRLLSHIRMAPQESRVRGVSCYVLSGDLPAEALREVGATQGSQRIWVGRGDYLIHRSLTKVHRTTTAPIVGRRPGAGPQITERDEIARVEVVRVEPNVALPANAFSYTPPTGYRIVTDIRGKPFPAVALPDLQGRPVSFERYRGKTVVLLFWASWDLGSMNQLLVVQRFRNEHPDRDLVVLTASLDVDKAPAEAALRTQKVTLPTLMAGGDLEKRIAALDLVSLPKIFLLDQKGTIRDVISSQISLQELVQAVRAVRSGEPVATPAESP
jgi:outer membrane lipoprotein-sorting protein